MLDKITLAHGSGGRLTYELIRDVFHKHLTNDILDKSDDSAILKVPAGRLAFTTDSFVVSPIFFKGGDIGKISVCGTVNDLSSAGAKPCWLSCGFIIEEGLPVEDLEKIVESMAKTAAECGVKIVTGDTKVVQKGAADKVFINTTGIGIIPENVNVSGAYAKPGDCVIISGTVGDHGCSILLEREQLEIYSEIKSDCAPLNKMVEEVCKNAAGVHVLRDPTRGGLATTINEIASQSGVGIRLNERSIPVKEEVRGVCEMLGMDPIYMANEGKMIIIAAKEDSNRIIETLKNNEYGRDACVIGEVVEDPEKRVIMETITGAGRFVGMLTGDQLPRIC